MVLGPSVGPWFRHSGGFFIQSVLDFGCAVGIMRQSVSGWKRSRLLGLSRREPGGGVMSVLELCDREIALFRWKQPWPMPCIRCWTTTSEP